MSRDSTIEAIILKTYDVGEADRFCVVLTKEKGRSAMRAKAVRKMTSKMGGTLLPMQKISAQVHEGKTGLLITSATLLESFDTSNFDAFLKAQQGTELLLLLLQDDEPLPEIYDLFSEFLCAVHSKDQCVLSFSLKTLSLLGVLPSVDHEGLEKVLSDEEHQFLRTAHSVDWQSTKQLSNNHYNRMKRWIDRIIEHQGVRLPHSDKIALLKP